MVFGRFLGGVVGNVLPVKPVFVVLVAQICAGLAAMAITLCSSTLTLGLCIATVGFMLGENVTYADVLVSQCSDA